MNLNLPDNTQLCVIVGSRAYGFAHEHSDYDYKGFFIAPTRQFWHLEAKPAEHYVSRDPDMCIYEIEKLMQLCLKGNPSVLDTLFAPERCVVYSKSWGRLLRAQRNMFLSCRAIGAYKGYAMSQIKKYLHSDLTDFKNAFHCARLIHAAIHLIKHGDIIVDMTGQPYYDTLKDIRLNITPPDAVLEYIKQLEIELNALDTEEAAQTPRKPDINRANELLQAVREEYLRGEK